MFQAETQSCLLSLNPLRRHTMSTQSSLVSMRLTSLATQIAGLYLLVPGITSRDMRLHAGIKITVPLRYWRLLSIRARLALWIMPRGTMLHCTLPGRVMKEDHSRAEDAILAG